MERRSDPIAPRSYDSDLASDSCNSGALNLSDSLARVDGLVPRLMHLATLGDTGWKAKE